MGGANVHRWLLVIALAALLFLGVYLGAGLPGRFPGLGRRDEREGPAVYGPVDIPADYKTTIIIWDYMWPGWVEARDGSHFETTDIPEPLGYRALMSRALAEFSSQYPNIQVEVKYLSFSGGGLEAARAAAEGTGPDVLAVWWGGPLPGSADVIPATPFITDADMSASHPLGWDLARHLRGHGAGDDIWIWPRWIAFHYWLLNPGSGSAGIDPDDVVEAGWTAADAAAWLKTRRGDEAADRRATPFMPFPGGTALLGELMAARAGEPENGDGSQRGGPAGRGGPGGRGSSAEGGGAAGDDVEAGEAGPRLAAALDLLRSSVDWGDPPRDRSLPGSLWGRDPVARLAEGRFTAAGGVGPALGAWPFLPPPGRPDGWEPKDYLLLPPPAAGEDPGPGALPVVSAGGYAVLKSAPDPSPEHVQAAMHLARFLSYRTGRFTADRMTALPTNLSSLSAWRKNTPLAGGVADQMVADAGRASTAGYRLFPPAGMPLPATPEYKGLAASLEDFWRGEAAAADVIRALFSEGHREDISPVPEP